MQLDQDLVLRPKVDLKRSHASTDVDRLDLGDQYVAKRRDQLILDRIAIAAQRRGLQPRSI